MVFQVKSEMEMLQKKQLLCWNLVLKYKAKVGETVTTEDQIHTTQVFSPLQNASIQSNEKLTHHCSGRKR